MDQKEPGAASVASLYGEEASSVVQAPSDKVSVDPCRLRSLANGAGLTREIYQA